MSGWGAGRAASRVHVCWPGLAPGLAPRRGCCCPSACAYLQSEAETLQLDVARVSEPWLLTALGAWPAPAPFPSATRLLPREGPCQPGRARGLPVSQTRESGPVATPQRPPEPATGTQVWTVRARAQRPGRQGAHRGIASPCGGEDRGADRCSQLTGGRGCGAGGADPPSRVCLCSSLSS